MLISILCSFIHPMIHSFSHSFIHRGVISVRLKMMSQKNATTLNHVVLIDPSFPPWILRHFPLPSEILNNIVTQISSTWMFYFWESDNSNHCRFLGCYYSALFVFSACANQTTNVSFMTAIDLQCWFHRNNDGTSFYLIFIAHIQLPAQYIN